MSVKKTLRDFCMTRDHCTRTRRNFNKKGRPKDNDVCDFFWWYFCGYILIAVFKWFNLLFCYRVLRFPSRLPFSLGSFSGDHDGIRDLYCSLFWGFVCGLSLSCKIKASKIDLTERNADESRPCELDRKKKMDVLFINIKSGKRTAKSKGTKRWHELERLCVKNAEIPDIENAIEYLWSALQNAQEILKELCSFYVEIGIEAEKNEAGFWRIWDGWKRSTTLPSEIVAIPISIDATVDSCNKQQSKTCQIDENHAHKNERNRFLKALAVPVVTVVNWTEYQNNWPHLTLSAAFLNQQKMDLSIFGIGIDNGDLHYWPTLLLQRNFKIEVSCPNLVHNRTSVKQASKQADSCCSIDGSLKRLWEIEKSLTENVYRLVLTAGTLLMSLVI